MKRVTPFGLLEDGPACGRAVLHGRKPARSLPQAPGSTLMGPMGEGAQL